MPLRSSQPRYFIMTVGTGAVSHWTAKDASLSLQGWVIGSHWTWTESKLPLHPNWLITFPVDTTLLSQLVSILVMWDRKLPMSLMTSRDVAVTISNAPTSADTVPWGVLGSWKDTFELFKSLSVSSFNHSNHFKYYCFQPLYHMLEPNQIKSFTNEAMWMWMLNKKKKII